MTDTPELFYDTHIFCCINERKEGHPRGSCARGGSGKLQSYLKSKCKKLRDEKTVRVNKSGCLDRCELGPVMVIYPEGIWYHYSNKDDVDEIFEEHIQNGNIVERLLLTPDQ